MNSALTLDQLRNCLEGTVPSGIATCDADGMPNVTYVSQSIYVDAEHLALSFQFFNKTRENILANPVATVLVMDPDTAARYRLQVRYLRTEQAGPLFERMKAKLAGIASHTGMNGIFELRGADLYRVLAIEPLPGRELPPLQVGPPVLPALRRVVDGITACTSLDALLDNFMQSIARHFGFSHLMLLMAEPERELLYVVASQGYPDSGAGAEIPYGVGVIGVAARERVPIRIMFPASDYAYSRAVREQIARTGQPLELEIPMPGLPRPGSQMAIPICACTELIGVLYVESLELCRFGYDLEDALVALCAQLGLALKAQQMAADSEEPAAEPAAPDARTRPRGPALKVRHYPRDNSVFLDDDYLIKGVAGAILWKLLHEQAAGRTEFSNRELRLDRSLGLPEVGDNLDARLILLARRLAERCPEIRLSKTGRGRFRLELRRPVELIQDA